MKRQYHTATAIAVSYSQVVVVVFGGVDEYISDNHDDREQLMKAATGVLEFGKYIIPERSEVSNPFPVELLHGCLYA